jgi:hypothetical protein
MNPNKIISLFNEFILYALVTIHKVFHIETMEDAFHKHKENTAQMNKVKYQFKNTDEFDIVKNNILSMITNPIFLHKYELTTESILRKDNNKLTISFQNNCIYVHFNHYYISGPAMFILLNKMVNSNSSPRFLQTNPLLGITYLPCYLYELLQLQKKAFPRTENPHIEHVVTEKVSTTNNKRCSSYYNIMKKVYHSLQLDRPMTVAISIAFEELPHLTNNVGVILLQYEREDTMETVERKLQRAYYQAYCSNFILQCPFLPTSHFELRDYVDCILSSMYIKSDFDFTVAWNCSKAPVEQMYVGSVSILHSDGTMDMNMCFNTCSANYRGVLCREEGEEGCRFLDNYFEDGSGAF